MKTNANQGNQPNQLHPNQAQATNRRPSSVEATQKLAQNAQQGNPSFATSIPNAQPSIEELEGIQNKLFDALTDILVDRSKFPPNAPAKMVEQVDEGIRTLSQNIKLVECRIQRIKQQQTPTTASELQTIHECLIALQNDTDTFISTNGPLTRSQLGDDRPSHTF